MGNPVVDVIVPVYRPDDKFYKLLQQLKQQTWPVHRIILMNTEKKFWDEFWKTREGLNMENLEVHHISKAEFDHGGTRNQGVSYSEADVIVLMTDDAVPEDDHLIANLVKGFQRKGPNGEMVSSVYARQLPAPDCRIVERYTRSFNYPEESRVKTKADLAAMGIKTYFCSNVCCAYDAKVIHSHNLSPMEQFHRNFDLAVSQADHPEIFAGLPSEGEGIRLVKKTAGWLCKTGKPWLVPSLVLHSGMKYLGYRMGKRYQKLPEGMVKKCTMNRAYWEKKGEDAS